jgi:hypothetical protein
MDQDFRGTKKKGTVVVTTLCKKKRERKNRQTQAIEQGQGIHTQNKKQQQEKYMGN